METTSIKALALKALQGNRQGNRSETVGFQGEPRGKQESFQVSPPSVETDKPYTIIYSHLLKDTFLWVNTDKQANMLRRDGVQDVIYTTEEALTLRNMTADEIRKYHEIKKAFPMAKFVEFQD